MQRSALAALSLILTVTFVAHRTLAAAQSSAPVVVERTYDIRDLIIDVPDFDAGLTTELGPSTLRNNRKNNAATRPIETREQCIDDVRRLIMDEVDPTSWRERVGTIGSIEQRSAELTIRQTSANQDAIAALLESMRRTRAVQITLEVRFLTGDAAFKTLEQISKPNHWLIENDLQTWPAYLDRNQVDAVVNACQGAKNGTIVTGPRLTLFNGQRAYVVVARQTAYVRDLVAGKPTDAEPYKPAIDFATSGVLIDAQTRASADRRGVIVTVRPQAASLLDITPQRWPKSPPGRNDLMVQVPQMSIFRGEMTTSIPDDHTAVFRVRKHFEPSSTTQPAGEAVMILVHPVIVRQKSSAAKTDRDGASDLRVTKPS